MAAGRIAAVVALVWAGAAQAQFAPPEAPKLTGAELFKRQCATCHTVVAGDPPRQGPTMAGVSDRKAGTVPGFKYSAGFAAADWNWTDDRLDTWLTNPQAMIPGSIMAYRQTKADIRASIIAYLHEVP